MSDVAEKPIGIAVLGLGNVGSQVVRIIEESAADLTARIGAPLVVRGIGVLSLIHISEPTRQCCTSRMPSSA